MIIINLLTTTLACHLILRAIAYLPIHALNPPSHTRPFCEISRFWLTPFPLSKYQKMIIISLIYLLSVMTFILPISPILLVFTWLLIPIAVIDQYYTIIPDRLNYLLLWSGLLVSCTSMSASLKPEQAMIGAATGYLLLWSFATLFHQVSHKRGMGHGDFKLLAAIGAWTGWPLLLPILLMSSLLALLYGASCYLITKKPISHLPFGPFIAIASWLILYTVTADAKLTIYSPAHLC